MISPSHARKRGECMEKTEVEGERRAWKREERGASQEKAEIAWDGKISVARMRGENMERARKERGTEERDRSQSRHLD